MGAVVPLYPPDSRVGAWLATHDHLRRLAACHRVDVAREFETGSYVLDGVHVHGRKELQHVVAVADVVISHLGDRGVAHRLARAAGKPSVRMVHGLVDNAAEKLRGAALAVFNSHASREAQPHDCPSIVAHPYTAPAPPVHGDRVTLVNLIPAKGAGLFWQLAAAMPERLFLGVKGGYGRQTFNAQPNVEVVPVTRDMGRDVYARTRVLLMPSERETWGMVGVEAITRGIPVVAHPTPGLVESLGDAGIFVDRSDLAGWRREVERLADPDEWQQASHASLARAGELQAIPSPFVEAVYALVGASCLT